MRYLSSSSIDPHLIHGDVGLLRVVWADSGEFEELWDVEEDGVENHRKDEMTGTELTSGGGEGGGYGQYIYKLHCKDPSVRMVKSAANIKKPPLSFPLHKFWKSMHLTTRDKFLSEKVLQRICCIFFASQV